MLTIPVELIVTIYEVVWIAPLFNEDFKLHKYQFQLNTFGF